MVPEHTIKQPMLRILTLVALMMIMDASALFKRAMASDIYFHSINIDRKIEDVWSGLVTKSLIDSYYFAPISADLTKTGQMFYYGSQDRKLILGKVLELDTPNILKHSFGFEGEDPEQTTVTYALASKGALTTLTISHEGYSKSSQSYADIAGGWPIILNGLKTKLESE